MTLNPILCLIALGTQLGRIEITAVRVTTRQRGVECPCGEYNIILCRQNRHENILGLHLGITIND